MNPGNGTETEFQAQHSFLSLGRNQMNPGNGTETIQKYSKPLNQSAVAIK